jgi:hypothetical protein
MNNFNNTINYCEKDYQEDYQENVECLGEASELFINILFFGFKI